MSGTLTPEEQLALLNYMGMGMYGSPLMGSAASQLNLVQDLGSMAFDTVFMYNMGLITPEQLLDGIKNATREPVGDAAQYDWESDYRQILASNETDKVNGVNAIINGTMTAAQYIRSLAARLGEEGQYDLNPALESNLDSLQKELEDFETKYNNFNFIKNKVDSGEYELDQVTGMVYKPLLGEDARENLRAQGWKGPFSEPEFWRLIPEPGLIQEAARLNDLAGETEKELSKAKTTVTPKAIKQGAKVGSAAYEEFLSRTPEGKRFLEAEKKKASDKKKETVPTALENAEAYVKRVAPPSLSFIPLKFAQAPLSLGKALIGGAQNALSAIQGTSASVPRGDALEKTLAQVEKEKKEAENQAYWAKMAESYTARGEQEQAMKPVTDLQKKVEQQKQSAAAKETEAYKSGTVPALEWLRMMPQLAAMAAQPAPQAPRATYVKPKPRVLSDQEIEIMANMIAGGMG
jgi:hypothetical protein